MNLALSQAHKQEPSETDNLIAMLKAQNKMLKQVGCSGFVLYPFWFQYHAWCQAIMIDFGKFWPGDLVLVS